jgi:aminoglycoside phosphotransferase (APT) family kinase protein
MGTEAEFLRERAATSGIGPGLAARAIEAVTGSRPGRVERIGGGWGAVPFSATAEDGTELVVRVGYEDRPYEREASVMRAMRAEGIPAPEVVGVCRVDDRPVSVLVRVDGTPLVDLAAARGGDDAEVAVAQRDAGATLARVHAVDPSGLELRQPIDDPADVVVEQARQVGASLGVAGDWIDALAARLGALREAAQATLVHGDFGADHVFVESGRVVGVIDWERAGFDDPARDLGWWLAYEEAFGGGAARLAEGYGPVDGGFRERVLAWAIAECVAGASFQATQGRSDAAAWGLARARDLAGAACAGRWGVSWSMERELVDAA